MRRFIAILFWALFISCAISAKAQEGESRISLLVAGASSLSPIAAAEVRGPSGNLIALGDTYGFVSLLAAVADSAFIVVSADGYRPDTLQAPFPAEVLLHLIGSSIEEVVVRRSVSTPVTPSRNHEVVDYSFVGDYLLVATSRSFKEAALLMLGSGGDTLAQCALREVPDAVFTACDGTPYVVYPNHFYPLEASSGRMELGRRYPSGLLSRVQSCQLSIEGSLYYKSILADKMLLLYYMLPASDTSFRTFLKLEDRATAIASIEEDPRALPNDWRMRTHFGNSFELAAMRQMRNSLALRELDVPLLRYRDTLMVPNLTKRHLICFDLDGKFLRTIPMRFPWGPLVRFDLLQDAATGRIYLHRHHKPRAQTIQELDPYTGELIGREVKILKPFAQKVRIRAGRLYYLWQDDHAISMRQLFAQTAFLVE